MGIHILYTTTCDGCGLVVTREMHYPEPPKAEDDPDYGITTTYRDQWGPGWPSGWTRAQWQDEIAPDEFVARFFHANECLKAWLIRTGHPDIAADMDNWIAVA